MFFFSVLLSALQQWGELDKWIDGRVERGRGLGRRRGRWRGWRGDEVRKKNKTKTDKECQALETGMLQLYVSHLATSPPHHLPPTSPSPAALSNSTNLLRMYGCSSNKTYSVLAAKDVGLHWTHHSAAHWPPGPFSAHTKEWGTKTLKAGAAPQRKHLLVIVFDCIMKMMFFFNLGLLRPQLFSSGHLIIIKNQTLTCPIGRRGGKYWKRSKDLPTLYFNPSCVSSVHW